MTSSDAAWKQMEDKAEEASAGGEFLRFKNDRDSAVVAFIGDPTPREVVWTGEGYVTADSDEGGALVASGKKPSLRVAMRCYVFKQRAVQTWEMNAPTFKGLVKVRNKYGLGEQAFEIERQGAAGDPKTEYSILPERKLTEDEKRMLASVAQVSEGSAPAAPARDPAPAITDDERIDLATARQLADRLRALADAQKAASELLTHFRASKLRELRASDRRAALAFVDELEIAARDSDDLPF